jgi:hypothetical protein
MSLRRLSIVAALTLGLTTAATASAGSASEETIRLNPADQTAARSATLRRSDFKPGFRNAWLAVRVKQAISLPQCPGDADMSRLVITGVASRRWLGGTMEVDTQTGVMREPWMLRGEWRSRTFGRPALDCVRHEFSRVVATDGDRLVSFTRMSVPDIAPYCMGVRMVVDMSARHIPERSVVETIAIGRGRTLVVLTVSGFLSDEQLIYEAALRYAERLARRIEA